MKQGVTLLFAFLLFCTSQAFANRPGAEENNMAASPPASADDTVMQKSSGDVLEISDGETIDIKLIDFPSRGMSMRKVLDTLGKPNKTIDAVGTPPIRSWVYKDRTIYFENMTVIHVVSKP